MNLKIMLNITEKVQRGVDNIPSTSDNVIKVTLSYEMPAATPEIYYGPQPGAIRVPKCLCTGSPNEKPHYPALSEKVLQQVQGPVVCSREKDWRCEARQNS